MPISYKNKMWTTSLDKIIRFGIMLILNSPLSRISGTAVFIYG